jgi:hypothetical protein
VFLPDQNLIRLMPRRDAFSVFGLLHEVAHWWAPTPLDDMHGYDWRRAQCQLVAQFIGLDYAIALKDAYDAAGFAC